MSENLEEMPKLLNIFQDHLLSWKIENCNDNNNEMMNLAFRMDSQINELKETWERFFKHHRKPYGKFVNQKVLQFITDFPHLRQLVHNPDCRIESHVTLAKKYQQFFECNKFFKQFRIPFENFNKAIWFEYLGICYFDNVPTESFKIFSFAVFPGKYNLLLK
jgi:hypothetical protein